MAINVEIDIETVSDIGPKTRKGVMRYLRDGADKGHSIALDNAPVDRGTLQQQLASFTPTIDGDTVRWGVRDVPYARAMEEGTQPFQPPVQPLLEWSERVSGDKGLGWYVATVKIPKEGIDAQPYARPGRDAQVNWYKGHSPTDYIEDELE